MPPVASALRRTTLGTLPVLAAASVLAAAQLALAAVSLTQVSADPYTNTTSFHATEVEPDTFASGSTIVAAFQVGRFEDGGASNVGWATSTDGGKTWTNGFLPAITKLATPPGPYDRDTDPSVAYDAKHGAWMISSLPLTTGGGLRGAAVVVSRSTDGGLTWGDPVTVANAGGTSDFDKNWTACDGTPTSPSYGNCYTEWDDFGHSNHLRMSVSTDGGLTWRSSTVPNSTVIGGQPVVQPNGTVVVPIDTGSESKVESFVSTNGGSSYTGPFTIAGISTHREAGNFRSDALPSAEVDGSGKVYVAWADCRFRTGCSANDIVLSTSTDGVTWTAPARVPIDGTTSGVDHFLPGLAVDAGTSGSSAHLTLLYHSYPNTSCSSSTCQLDVGYVASPDGGATWTTPIQLAGPITLTWLPLTSQGYMVGDYVSTSYAGGKAHPVFMNATAGSCTLGIVTSCHEFAVTTSTGIRAGPATLPLDHATPVPGARSDHPATGPLTQR